MMFTLPNNPFNGLDFVEPGQFHKMMQEMVDAKEQLIREHFAETPIALASVVRTGVLPWNVEVQTRRAEPEFGDDADSVTLRIREYVRVVEYPRNVRPGRWK